jgi:metal-dependent amidase/aminoacylase/carboxypeptidase family protein
MKQLQILAWFVFIPNLLYSQKLPEGLDRAITDISSKVAEVRRQLHVHPELSNQEYNTSAFVSEYLKKLGLEVHTGIANTGIVAILKGQKSGPVIALRADMDGLPVFERNNLPNHPFRRVSESIGEYNT